MVSMGFRWRSHTETTSNEMNTMRKVKQKENVRVGDGGKEKEEKGRGRGKEEVRTYSEQLAAEAASVAHWTAQAGMFV